MSGKQTPRPRRSLRAALASGFRAIARRLDTSNGPGSVYRAAGGGRLVADWNAPYASADVAHRGDMLTIRARARQLVRDNAHARRFVQLCAKNIIGPSAMLLRPRVKDARGNLDTATNNAIKAAFETWSSRKYFSADGRLSRGAFTRLLWQSLVVDGEVLVRKLDGFDNPHGFALQLLDPDLLDQSLIRAPDANGDGEIRMGVEVDRWNRAAAYWLWNRHPSEMGQRVRTRVPAAEIEHLFIPLRPGQTRGISWLAPAMYALNMLDGYREAELVAARMGAAKMAAIVTKTPEAIAAWSAKDIVTTTNGEDAEPARMSFSPGLIPELLPGQELMMLDPTHPTSAFGPFETAILRTIAMALDVSYTSLAGDLSNANYSSARVGLVDERDSWRTIQAFHVEHFEEPVYEAWMRSAVLTGALRLPSFDVTRFLAADFKPRGWKWVDPANEIAALKEEIGLGINTRTRAAAEQGRDFDEDLEELAREEDLADALEVDVSGATTTKRETATEPADTSGNPPSAASNGDGQDDSTDDTTTARSPRRNRLRAV
ncbi:MAG: phage portal protein [Gemmatimonadaceae bacterium]|nr:phage portal protein [Gemmatimonadaceae bacterium]